MKLIKKKFKGKEYLYTGHTIEGKKLYDGSIVDLGFDEGYGIVGIVNYGIDSGINLAIFDTEQDFKKGKEADISNDFEHDWIEEIKGHIETHNIIIKCDIRFSNDYNEVHYENMKEGKCNGCIAMIKRKDNNDKS